MIAASFVYLLSLAVSLTCAVLLFRAVRRTPSKLVLAAAICFTGFALNDATVIVDLFVLPDVNLVAVRSLPALAGVGALVWALVRECR